MFLFTGVLSGLSRGFPRIRGDVPALKALAQHGYQFSPHTRGCSQREFKLGKLRGVFPAYAGMFRAWPIRYWWGSCFPRIRGDVPYYFL